ncbi:MAG TPA: 4-alpha-glucanotransferase [Candidatus Limnocylindria bacterium]
MSRIVDDSYVDAFRKRRAITPEVRAAVLAAMGLRDDAGVDPAGGLTAVVRPGGALPEAGHIVLEDGTELGHGARLPADVPFGYHRLHRDDGTVQLLITGPGRCLLPDGLRDWGWAVQLAGLRSLGSWGIGELADLRELAAWSATRGAGFVAVSPLGAPNPDPDPEPSPYYPSTRRFVNPLHLRVDEVPGADRAGDIGDAARSLNRDRRIDRTRVLALKRAALERIWATGPPERDVMEAWRRERGESVDHWGTFCVLSERFGPGWQRWPEPYRDPRGAAVSAVARDDADGVAFHAWIQWSLDRQLEDASSPLRRIADMPVGVDPGGFDAWEWQAQLALGASVGAPPDRFTVAGQDWGLPPFIPHRLREAHYLPFIDTVRAQLRHAGGLRIDHVLGFFRLWWIPAGAGPASGAYVRYPTEELLEIVAIESHRAGAIIIGEDLGTVPAGVRRELRHRRVLSTRLAYFEKTPPERWPRNAFAAVTTHDLPTVAGLLSGSDVADQRAAGVMPNPTAQELLRTRVHRIARTPSTAGLDEVLEPLHRRLAAAPPILVAGSLEDSLGVEERPNLPGTTSARRENWSLALPEPLEEILDDARVRRVTGALASR